MLLLLLSLLIFQFSRWGNESWGTLRNLCKYIQGIGIQPGLWIYLHKFLNVPQLSFPHLENWKINNDNNSNNTYLTALCSVTQLCSTLCDPWTVTHQAPLSTGFPRQEYWSGLPFPPPGDLPNPGIESTSPDFCFCPRVLGSHWRSFPFFKTIFYYFIFQV